MCVRVFMYVLVPLCVCVYAYIYVCMYVYVCVCVCMRCVYAYNVYACMYYVCMHVYMCECMYEDVFDEQNRQWMIIRTVSNAALGSLNDVLL